jgi:hypothetical protein
MNAYIFTVKKPSAPGIEKKARAFFEILPAAALAKHDPGTDGISYLDITGMDKTSLKKSISLIKKRCAGSSWGIIDPKGEADDPAVFFFNGASDYLNGKTLKGLTKKRLDLAVSAGSSKTPAAGAAPGKKGKTESVVRAGRSARLPPIKFEGWQSMKSGMTAHFFFLYVSFSSGKSNLRSRLGEKNYTVVRGRMRSCLLDKLKEADALLWMETESDYLFLIPPKANNGKAALVASLKMILSSPLIGAENLGLSIHANFTFALHFGETPWQAPGRTGTVVSGAVNFIFHLGAKHAGADKLTISSEVPAEAIPPELDDLFVDSGEYEGFGLISSRRFTYSQL